MTDPEALLTHGYRQARDITRMHGTTYYWGTLFLPPQQRRDVYGLYALCRLADDIVDEPEEATGHGLDASLPPGERLAQFEQRFQADLAAGRSDDPLFAAIVDTARRLDLDSGCYDRFFGAMQLDLVRTSWASWPQLRDEYMEGSAAVIGEMMLPVLRPRSGPRAGARVPADELPARCRRRPRTRSRLPARRRPRRARRRPVAAPRHPAVARVHGRADRPKPRAVPRRRSRSAAPAGLVATVRRRGARDVLTHPVPHRGGRLRRVQHAPPRLRSTQERHRGSRRRHRTRPNCCAGRPLVIGRGERAGRDVVRVMSEAHPTMETGSTHRTPSPTQTRRRSRR